MTLGEFLTASSDKDVLVSLTNSGETEKFAVVSASAAESLSDAVKAKVVSEYKIESLTKLAVTITDGI